MRLGLGLLVGLVDPDLVGQVEDLGQWSAGAEPFRMRDAGCGEGVLARVDQLAPIVKYPSSTGQVPAPLVAASHPPQRARKPQHAIKYRRAPSSTHQANSAPVLARRNMG